MKIRFEQSASKHPGIIMSVLFLLSLGLSGCGTFSKQNVEHSYNQCVQDGGSFIGKIVACNIAISSGRYHGTNMGDLYFMKGIHQQDANRHHDAIASFGQALRFNSNDHEAYYYRGVSRRTLGYLNYAQQDFDTAARLKRDPAFERAARNNYRDMQQQYYAQQQAQRRAVSLYYKGMQCRRIQKDSVFYPANEIHIDIVVVDQDGRYRTTALPARNKVYKGIKKGSVRKAHTQVWQGMVQPLTLQVVMWEYDDGGPLVESLTEVAIDFALTRGTRTMGKYAVKKGANKMAVAGGRKAVKHATKQLDLTGQLARQISSLPKALVGANNDLVGAIGITNISPDNYRQTRNYRGIKYDFATRHRRGGADCNVYFQFR